MKKKSLHKSNSETFLVCGGAGFIGSHFVRLLLSKYPTATVVNYDVLTYAGNPHNLDYVARDSRYVFVKGDIRDEKQLHAVFEKYAPEYVVNFAAETHVDRSIHGDTSSFVTTNVDGVFRILEEVRRAKQVKKFVQVSTDEVYGSLSLGGKKKFTERSPLAPNSPYAASKAGGDLLCRSYAETFGVPVVITRCGNNYGPNQYPEKLIPFFIQRIKEGKTLPLYGDGKNVRDWIYVEDHAQAIEMCMQNGRVGEVYNVGANNERNNREIASIIVSYFKKDKPVIEYVVDRLGHDRRYAIDCSKIQEELGWRAKTSFKKGMQMTIAWYRDNEQWMKKKA